MIPTDDSAVVFAWVAILLACLAVACAFVAVMIWRNRLNANRLQLSVLTWPDHARTNPPRTPSSSPVYADRSPARRYCYNGFLTPQTAEWIEHAAERNPYVLEMSSHPQGFSQWTEDNLRKFPDVVEGCMGVEYMRETVMYTIISKHEGGRGGPFFSLPQMRRGQRRHHEEISGVHQ